MREHMSCNDLAVSEGGCAGENCRLPVCVVCGRDWPCPVQRVLDLLVQRYVDAMNIASAKIEQLQTEVEALRARNETLIATIQRQDSTFERQMEEHEELEALRAQVQRVREECEYPWFFDVGEHSGETPQGLPFVETAAVLKALDGGDE